MHDTVDLSVSMVVAMTHERVIGYENKIPWDIIRSDRKHFAELTKQTGVVIMGRKTFESIIATNGRPLPDRFNIVLTSNIKKAHTLLRKAVPSQRERESVAFATNVEEALCLAKQHCQARRVGMEVFVIGGEHVYETFLPITSKVYATLIDTCALGDTFFPDLSLKEWAVSDETALKLQCPGDPYRTAYFEYKRISDSSEVKQAC